MNWAHAQSQAPYSSDFPCIPLGTDPARSSTITIGSVVAESSGVSSPTSMAHLSSSCPKCGKSIRPQDLHCPSCLTPLKAHGHPGITIHYAQDNEPLCLTCELHADNSCSQAKRPNARDCTLYLDREQLAEAMAPQRPSFRWRSWARRYSTPLLLGSLVLLALVVSLLS